MCHLSRHTLISLTKADQIITPWTLPASCFSFLFNSHCCEFQTNDIYRTGMTGGDETSLLIGRWLRMNTEMNADERMVDLAVDETCRFSNVSGTSSIQLKFRRRAFAFSFRVHAWNWIVSSPFIGQRRGMKRLTLKMQQLKCTSNQTKLLRPRGKQLHDLAICLFFHFCTLTIQSSCHYCIPVTHLFPQVFNIFFVFSLTLLFIFPTCLYSPTLFSLTLFCNTFFLSSTLNSFRSG